MRIAKFVLSAIAVLVIGVVIGVIGFVYWAPEKATSFAINAERNRSSLLRKEIDLPGGLHYVYLEGGKGETLMLLHGLGANKDSFTKVAHFLTPHYRVIVPDNIGSGESSHPLEADYAPPAQAERLRAFAHALGIARLHLGGNSMGGQIAMTYAARYPAEVASLWLLDPSGVWSAPKTELMKTIAKTGRNQLMPKSVDEFAQVLKLVMYNPPFIPWPMMQVLAQERIRNNALEEQISRLLESDRVEKRITGLPVPTLIVWGARDQVLSVESAEILHKLMPHSRVIAMPDTGHVPMMERPEQCVEDYLKFRAASL
ncbi:MAG: alpha/beta hydrolase [Deltaproteobacteria bacterium]|nr:alpha/beta hydrolase [Deltaproteobacteria bacterium]